MNNLECSGYPDRMTGIGRCVTHIPYGDDDDVDDDNLSPNFFGYGCPTDGVVSVLQFSDASCTEVSGSYFVDAETCSCDDNDDAYYYGNNITSSVSCVNFGTGVVDYDDAVSDPSMLFVTYYIGECFSQTMSVGYSTDVCMASFDVYGNPLNTSVMLMVNEVDDDSLNFTSMLYYSNGDCSGDSTMTNAFKLNFCISTKFSGLTSFGDSYSVTYSPVSDYIGVSAGLSVAIG